MIWYYWTTWRGNHTQLPLKVGFLKEKCYYVYQIDFIFTWKVDSRCYNGCKVVLGESVIT